jgi:hypothetical protein
MPKPPYWLDANIFIEANNTFFNIEIAPSFWAWLETQLRAGVLKSSSLVYGELLGKDDKLAKWARVRKGDAYWPEPDGEVQAAYREISDYVDDKYKDASPAKVGDFLAKADFPLQKPVFRAHQAQSREGFPLQVADNARCAEQRWVRNVPFSRAPG